MLPIGLIIVLVLLFYFVSFGRGYFPGELLVIFVVVFLGLFVIRTLYWRSRRKYWREQLRGNEPIRIIRQRYARGEISKEQFDQMLRDLTQKPST
jgi:putative membrane protein